MCEYINKKFNNLTVLRDVGKDKHSHKLVEVICDCDKQTIFIARLRSLIDGNTHSCGCHKSKMSSSANKKYNRYDLSGEYGIGYTFKDEPFYFDLEDYDKIKDHCWYFSHGYVCAYKVGLFHRFILEVSDNEIIDHIGNINMQDNRKSNLRIVTNSQNQMNRKSYTELKLKGISWRTWNNSWHGQIKKGKNHVYSKYFKNLKDAIEDKIKFEKDYFKEYRYAWENDIDWDFILEYEKNLKHSI